MCPVDFGSFLFMVHTMFNLNVITGDCQERGSTTECKQDTVKGCREGVRGAGRGGGQFIEVRMTVKNRWDEAAEECFVGGMLWEGVYGGKYRGKLGQCPYSVHQRPFVPRCPMSAFWQERWDLNTEFFTTRHPRLLWRIPLLLNALTSQSLWREMYSLQ